jgi:hypothetical protein
LQVNGPHPERPVGILASYVGGTPVGCWADDPKADDTCHVAPSTGAQVPCDPAHGCCPGKLFNGKVAPLLGAGNVRAALWYQGEVL